MIDQATLNSIREDLIKATQAVLIARGVEKNSDLVKTIDYKEKDGVFTLLVNDYYEYVSTGRKPRARKVPIEDLVAWVKEKRIRPRAGQTVNQLAFAIQTSIYKSGIKGKKYMRQVEEVSFDIYEKEIMDALEVSVADAMANAFKI